MQSLTGPKRISTKEKTSMTEKVTINGTDYALAPINFEQWEEGLFASDGQPLSRAKTGFLVARSLENANEPSNPNMKPSRPGTFPSCFRSC